MIKYYHKKAISAKDHNEVYATQVLRQLTPDITEQIRLPSSISTAQYHCPTDNQIPLLSNSTKYHYKEP